MKFDEREATAIFFIGEESISPKRVVEMGDEALLYHDGKIVMSRISSLNGNQIVATVTRSVLNPDLHPEFTTEKEIQFFLENIFGISKMTKKA